MSSPTGSNGPIGMETDGYTMAMLRGGLTRSRPRNHQVLGGRVFDAAAARCWYLNAVPDHGSYLRHSTSAPRGQRTGMPGFWNSQAVANWMVCRKRTRLLIGPRICLPSAFLEVGAAGYTAMGFAH